MRCKAFEIINMPCKSTLAVLSVGVFILYSEPFKSVSQKFVYNESEIEVMFAYHIIFIGALFSSMATKVNSPETAFSLKSEYISSTKMSTLTFKLVLPT